MQKRWPLHPTPYRHEALDRYVRRLAESYDARFETFCLNALGIPRVDGEARRFIEPSAIILSRLSDGTGIPIVQLEQMPIWKLLNWLMKEVREYTAIPENYPNAESS